jgi:glutamate synthase domain-containing protein 2
MRDAIVLDGMQGGTVATQDVFIEHVGQPTLAVAHGADAVSIGSAALVALGDNDPIYEEEYNKLRTTVGAYDDWHESMVNRFMAI